MPGLNPPWWEGQRSEAKAEPPAPKMGLKGDSLTLDAAAPHTGSLDAVTAREGQLSFWASAASQGRRHGNHKNKACWRGLRGRDPSQVASGAGAGGAGKAGLRLPDNGNRAQDR